MSLHDLVQLGLEALRAHRLRYTLSALAVAVGIAAVVLLASIGEGTRRFILAQMTQFGSTLVAVTPGRTETQGIPGVMGGSQKKLTLDDARAMSRLPGVAATIPTAYGTAPVRHGHRTRNVYIYGVNSEVPKAWSMPVAIGQFIPAMDYDRASPVVVLGPRVRRELFGDANPLGAAVRIGEARFRVIGVMASKGQFLGFDLDDAAYIPVANALRLLNRSEVDEVDLLAASPGVIDSVAERARRLMIRRHDGIEDVTIVTQREGLAMIDRIMGMVTGVVTGIAAISLLVGAIGILTIMWIVVQERVSEIGLIKALGATRRQILTWYLFEAGLTSLIGGIAGFVAGAGGAMLLHAILPGLESYTSPLIVALAMLVSLGVGVAAGVAPALRAAALDPVEALHGE